MSQFVERWPVGVRVPGSNPSDVRILYIKHGSVGESVHLYLRNVKQTVEPGSLKLGDRIKLKKKKKITHSRRFKSVKCPPSFPVCEAHTKPIPPKEK